MDNDGRFAWLAWGPDSLVSSEVFPTEELANKAAREAEEEDGIGTSYQPCHVPQWSGFYELVRDAEEPEEQETEENYTTIYLDGERLREGEALQDVNPYDVERVQVEFPDASNGYQSDAQERGALGWCNSAAISLDRKEDSVTVSISVGDPRGAFAFTVRRRSDGRLVMYVPYPGESSPHMKLRELHTGTYEIGE